LLMQTVTATPESERLLVADLWRRAEAFEIDYPTAESPFSRVLMDEMQWDETFTCLAILEYKKFMLLSVLFPNGNMTPSVHVDTVWHMHLLYTRSYHQFCKEALNSDFLHHEPSKGGTVEAGTHKDSYAETLNVYVKTFGIEPPHEIWGARVRSEL
jgi:hypothetical protein